MDESQSQRDLEYLITAVLEPPLIQNKGQLILAGTGPRVRGTEWERIWDDELHFPGLRLNWNISDNPYIEESQKILQRVLDQHGWTISTPRYIQEWLGRVAYDDDALVYRLTSDNLFEDGDLRSWIDGHNEGGIIAGRRADGTKLTPHTAKDICFVGGIDYGFNDADSVVVLMYSKFRPEIHLVYEYKARNEGVEALRLKIVEAMNYIKTDPLFAAIPEYNRSKWYFSEDSGGGGKKIGWDFSTQYGLPIQPAYKAEKILGIEQLQEEVKTGAFKVRGKVVVMEGKTTIVSDSTCFDESIRTVWKRNDKDEIVREIDDDVFHPDELDAILYAYRAITIYGGRKKE